MKTLTAILGTVVLLIFASTAVGEVVIEEEPLNGQKVARLDGDVVFNNLCAVCHGTGGKGDGPAVSALNKAVPDLTVFSANNKGVYPYFEVKNAITGNSRAVAHGTIDMPVWGQQFSALQPGSNSFVREAYARGRIHTLATHIESLQVE